VPFRSTPTAADTADRNRHYRSLSRVPRPFMPGDPSFPSRPGAPMQDPGLQGGAEVADYFAGRKATWIIKATPGAGWNA
jgi:hypothetical protein